METLSVLGLWGREIESAFPLLWQPHCYPEDQVIVGYHGNLLEAVQVYRDNLVTNITRENTPE